MIQLHCKIKNKEVTLSLQDGDLIDGVPLNQKNLISHTNKVLNDDKRFIEISTVNRRYLLNKSYIYSVTLDGDFDLKKLSTVWVF